jgi:polyisoprenyl-phosphate glycosyltransferase
VNPEVSVVVPTYRGAARLAALAARLLPVVEALDGEVVLVDDGSGDGTWAVIRALAAGNAGVRGARLARRSGQQTATLAGASLARGRWIVTIDDDLEHDPAVLAALLARARAGCDLVYGVPSTRRVSLPRRIGSRFFDLAFSLLIGKPPSLRLTSFRVMSRDLVAAMLRERAASIYVSALALRQKPRVAAVAVDPGPRAPSRYSLVRLAVVFGRTLAAYGILGRVVQGRPVREHFDVAEETGG